MKKTAHRKNKFRLIAVVVAGLVVTAGVVATVPRFNKAVVPTVSAACTTATLPTTFGVVTQTATVATAGTYRVWSRIKVPDTTANSYYFKVDTGCAYNVGDLSTIPVNTWTWVSYQDATTTSVIDLPLTAGTHTLTYTGKENGVQLDRLLLLTDTACVPTGTGDNCAVNDTVSPTVSITAPAAGATVSGTVNVAATAADASGISKVEFYVDGALKSTDTTSAYSYSWDTTGLTNATHALQAKAYDISGNIGTSTNVSVTVNNSTPTPTPTPTPPAGLTTSITAPANNTTVAVNSVVNIAAAAGTAVTKVDFLIDGVLKNTDTATPFTYAWNTTGYTNGAHSLTTKAYNAAGATVTSAAVNVTIGTVSTNMPGDVNGDSRVNALDLSALLSHDGQNFPAADFNNDGTVGAADMAIMLGKWTW